MARVFPVRAAIMNAADGILGTGLFTSGRMTLDMAEGQLVISESTAKPGPGEPMELRLVGDAKLTTPVLVQGEPALALIDSGADMVVLAPSRVYRHFSQDEVRKFASGVGIGVGQGQMAGLTLNPGIELKLGERVYKRYGGLGLDALDTLLSPMIGLQLDILLGMPTLRDARTLTVDYPACKMWIAWLEGRGG
jgi:hypothetical protein